MNYLETVQRLYDAFSHGGSELERSYFAPDFVWHVPGSNPVSGNYRGEAYFTEMPAKMAPLDRWEFEVKHLMENTNLVVATVHFRGERKGKRVDMDGAHVFRLDVNHKIVEGWGFAEKQDELDDFFA